MASLSFVVPVLLLHLMVQNGEPVRCWTCASDLDPACNDPFLVNNDTEYIKLENCDQIYMTSYTYLTSSKSVCKKQKKYFNGHLLTQRGCSWKRLNDNTTTCPNVYDTYNTKTALCETCDYDGCNGAAIAINTQKNL